jgi:glycosyltransferase involved in cell wall biosynthesis
MISIVIPTLNEEKFLPNLLESLVVQTKKDFEVVIVDGSSKDKTVELANSFASKLPKFQVVISKKASLPLQRNLGAKIATGEWLAFIDADSILFPQFIERVSDYIEKLHPKILTTWLRPDSEQPGDANIALLANMIFEMSIVVHRPFAPGPLTMVSRDVFTLVHGYDESCRHNEDMDFSMRVHKKHIPFTVIPETLYTWSLRRIRKEGSFRLLQQALISALPFLLFQHPVRYMPGYIMGGQLYGKKKITVSKGKFKQYEMKFKRLMKELFV